MQLPRWPFISRSAHDEIRTTLETQILRLQRELEKEQQRGAKLLETVLDLKLAGAAITHRPTVEGLKMARKPRSAIQQAIDENPLASERPALRSHLASWADKEMDRPLDPGETEDQRERSVLGRLRTWHVVRDRADDDEKDLIADIESYDDDDEVIAVGTDAPTAPAAPVARSRR